MQMKFLILVLSFFLLQNLKANLLSLSHFLNFFHNKNQTHLSSHPPENIQYQEIEPFRFLQKNEYSQGIDLHNEYFISNHIYFDADDFPLKHDLDYEADCDIKQGFLLVLKKLEMGVARDKKLTLRLNLEENFIEINEKTLSIFLDENPESLKESFSLKSIEFSKMRGFQNISCFAAHSEIFPDENPNIFRVFCFEERMLDLIF